MKKAMNPATSCARGSRARCLLLTLLLALTGCALPSPPARQLVYDFGPGSLSTPTAQPTGLAPLVVGELASAPALDSTALLYRLAYTDAQQLRPYALARWSMTPAQLLRQRLREHLGQQRALLNAGDVGMSGAAAPLTLRVELEEFSQLFETPDKSQGLLRLRATLVQASPSGEKGLAQRSVIVQRPAPTADAAGGVRALTAASDAAVQELAQWLASLGL